MCLTWQNNCKINFPKEHTNGTTNNEIQQDITAAFHPRVGHWDLDTILPSSPPPQHSSSLVFQVISKSTPSDWMNYKWTTTQGARMDLASEPLVMSKVVSSWRLCCFLGEEIFSGKSHKKKGVFHKEEVTEDWHISPIAGAHGRETSPSESLIFSCLRL